MEILKEALYWADTRFCLDGTLIAGMRHGWVTMHTPVCTHGHSAITLSFFFEGRTLQKLREHRSESEQEKSGNRSNMQTCDDLMIFPVFRGHLILMNQRGEMVPREFFLIVDIFETNSIGNRSPIPHRPITIERRRRVIWPTMVLTYYGWCCIRVGRLEWCIAWNLKVVTRVVINRGWT